MNDNLFDDEPFPPEPEDGEDDDSGDDAQPIEVIDEDAINEIFDVLIEDINMIRDFCLVTFKATGAIVEHYEQELEGLKAENESFKQELLNIYRNNTSIDDKCE